MPQPARYWSVQRHRRHSDVRWQLQRRNQARDEKLLIVRMQIHLLRILTPARAAPCHAMPCGAALGGARYGGTRNNMTRARMRHACSARQAGCGGCGEGGAGARSVDGKDQTGPTRRAARLGTGDGGERHELGAGRHMYPKKLGAKTIARFSALILFNCKSAAPDWLSRRVGTVI